jgi:hypothetical protein
MSAHDSQAAADLAGKRKVALITGITGQVQITIRSLHTHIDIVCARSIVLGWQLSNGVLT